MTKGDKRKLIAPLPVRTAYSIAIIPEGEIIEIQQVDNDYHKVLVANVWMHQSIIQKSSVKVEG